jgi:hypothetical protein
MCYLVEINSFFPGWFYLSKIKYPAKRIHQQLCQECIYSIQDRVLPAWEEKRTL